jgi:hypothetical protein
MLAVPYLSVAGVGFLIYRGVKKNEAHRAGSTRAAADGSMRAAHPPAGK